MNNERTRKIEILLIEDNQGDVELMKEAFGSASVHNTVQVVEDGKTALAYLRREGKFSDARRPDLILLDLNLPGVDGRQVLLEVKGDPNLRRIPVIVLTNSSEEMDVLKAYKLNVNSYITKPSDHDQLMTMVRGIEEFWLTVVKLPTD